MTIETANDAADSWRLIKGAAANAKRFSQAYSAELSAGSVTIERVFEMYRILNNIRAQIDVERQTAGLLEYVQTVRDDATYDAPAQALALVTAIQSVLTWVDSNSAGLNLSGDTAANYLVSGSVASNRFTPAQTSGMRTVLADVVSAVN